MTPKKINVLLLSPGYFSTSHVSFGDNHLVSLGSALKKWTGADVKIIDLDYEALLPDSQVNLLFNGGFDVIGVSCYSSFDYLKAFYLSKEIRTHNPNAVMVVGGYHVSARPDDFLGPDSPFDYVVVGEGELPLTRLVRELERDARPSERVLGPESVSDLNELPLMDWSLMDRYRPVADTIYGREVTLSFSRGCVFKCSFCMEVAMGPPNWRPFTPERAQQELENFHNWIDLTDRRLFISDPLFGLKRPWRLEMLDRIKRMNLPVRTIWALTRADVLHPDDLQHFKDARFGLGFGLESGDVDMMRIIHKGEHAQKYLEKFTMFAHHASQIGLPWGANIIVGHPGETPESIERSAKWVGDLFRSIKPLTGYLMVDPYRFYPGSPIDTHSDFYEKEYGTVFHRPRWWDFSEPEFTAMWIDPSDKLDFRTRERMMADCFLPILKEINANFDYHGYGAKDYGNPSVSQYSYFGPTRRLRTIGHYYTWNELTGNPLGDVRRDEEVEELSRMGRIESLEEVTKVAGPLPTPLRDALTKTPRHRFVDPQYVGLAHLDRTLPLLADGTSTISAIHAYAMNYKILELQDGDYFLELGGGTGYGAAVAAQLVGDEGMVKTFEIEPSLTQLSKENVKEYPQVEVLESQPDLEELIGQGFNKILYCYALTELPDVGDLLPIGGRILAPIPNPDGSQTLTMLEQTESGPIITQKSSVLYVADKAN